MDAVMADSIWKMSTGVGRVDAESVELVAAATATPAVEVARWSCAADVVLAPVELKGLVSAATAAPAVEVARRSCAALVVLAPGCTAWEVGWPEVESQAEEVEVAIVETATSAVEDAWGARATILVLPEEGV
jgi:hypothetical protein